LRFFITLSLAWQHCFPSSRCCTPRSARFSYSPRDTVTQKPGEELPPEFLGWIFVVLGFLLFLLGIAMAICILIAGRSLSSHKHYTFALVMACIECLFIPFGTILGVFAIVVLSRQSVRGLFSTATSEALA
jgi:hypothetical protein